MDNLKFNVPHSGYKEGVGKGGCRPPQFSVFIKDPLFTRIAMEQHDVGHPFIIQANRSGYPCPGALRGQLASTDDVVNYEDQLAVLPGGGVTIFGYFSTNSDPPPCQQV